jgi:hypothetical protein
MAWSMSTSAVWIEGVHQNVRERLLDCDSDRLCKVRRYNNGVVVMVVHPSGQPQWF